MPCSLLQLFFFLGLLQFVDEVVLETLKAADGDGRLPTHLAARNGHEGVLQFLQEVVSDTPAGAQRQNVESCWCM